MGNTFIKYFALFGGLGPNSRLYSTYLNQSKTSYDKFLVYTYVKLCTAMIKNNKYYLLKINRLHDIAIFAKS